MKHEINQEKISLAVKEDAFPMGAYLAYPATGGPYPAVMVVMELFGVNDNIRDITNQIARLGYVALAPDFYYRAKKGMDQDLPYGEEGRKQGFALLHSLRRDEVIEDVGASIAFLQSRSDVTGRMGIVGFSMGGHIAYLAATQYALAATACFYGGWLTSTEIELSRPQPTVSLTRGISRHQGKLVYFAGADDVHITPDQLAALEAALKAEQVRYELVVYPQASHGFFCDQRPADYNAQAHDDAWQRLQQLFAEELGPH